MGQTETHLGGELPGDLICPLSSSPVLGDKDAEGSVAPVLASWGPAPDRGGYGGPGVPACHRREVQVPATGHTALGPHMVGKATVGLLNHFRSSESLTPAM
jgi:hypothetical protein